MRLRKPPEQQQNTTQYRYCGRCHQHQRQMFRALLCNGSGYFSRGCRRRMCAAVGDNTVPVIVGSYCVAAGLAHWVSSQVPGWLAGLLRRASFPNCVKQL
jgi:hypothetical protein